MKKDIAIAGISFVSFYIISFFVNIIWSGFEPYIGTPEEKIRVYCGVTVLFIAFFASRIIRKIDEKK